MSDGATPRSEGGERSASNPTWGATRCSRVGSRPATSLSMRAAERSAARTVLRDRPVRRTSSLISHPPHEMLPTDASANARGGQISTGGGGSVFTRRRHHTRSTPRLPPPRIEAHVHPGWLALLLLRVAETEAHDSWRNIRDEPDPHAPRHAGHRRGDRLSAHYACACPPRRSCSRPCFVGVRTSHKGRIDLRGRAITTRTRPCKPLRAGPSPSRMHESTMATARSA